jgi:hypothetical protein
MLKEQSVPEYLLSDMQKIVEQTVIANITETSRDEILTLLEKIKEPQLIQALTNTVWEQRQPEPYRCKPGSPCRHPTTVDVRVIVLTIDRPKSLQKCLNSLDKLELDGHTTSMHIFIDRDKQNQTHNATVDVAKSFRWSKGPTIVHLQETHVGLYGQWVDSWRPKAGSNELALIIEDDIDVSPYAYRWVRLNHERHGHKDFISGGQESPGGARTAQGEGDQ